MRLAARELLSRGKQFFILIFTALLFLSSASLVSAQTYGDSHLNPDVPQDQHTKSQIMLIENSAAIICQLVGIDVVQPEKGCLGVDRETGKIGYAPHDEQRQVGGMLGLTANMFGAVYHPPASGTEYIAGLVDNFGIVKKTYAQEGPSGFEALYPVQRIWEITRNITYALLVLVFIGIGLGIMLRVKIDPRTAMSIQNQVPKIIVAILLITFSYSIIGFMVDIMWLSTYVGINAVSGVTNETICASGTGQELTVQENAYSNLLNSPIAFMNDLLRHPEPEGWTNPTGENCDTGIKYLSIRVSQTAGTFINELVLQVLGVGTQADCGPFAPFLNPGCFAGTTFAGFIGWLGQIFMLLVVFIAILIVMFRLWWQLLRAYALIVFYTILGPIWILLGLLPSSERNFNSWMRTVTAKLLSFPAAAIMIVIARALLDNYNPEGTAGTSVNPSEFFTPPLVGNPVLGDLGPLLAFAILLITPEVLNMLNDAFKAPASKYVGPAITGGLAAGFAAGAPAGFIGSRAFKYDSQGRAVGVGSIMLRNMASGKFREGTYGHSDTPPSRLRRIGNRAAMIAAKGATAALGGTKGGGGSGH